MVKKKTSPPANKPSAKTRAPRRRHPLPPAVVIPPKEERDSTVEIGGLWRGLIGLACLALLLGFLFNFNKVPVPSKTDSGFVSTYPQSSGPYTRRPAPGPIQVPGQREMRRNNPFKKLAQRLRAGVDAPAPAQPSTSTRALQANTGEKLPERIQINPLVTALPTMETRPASKPKPAADPKADPKPVGLVLKQGTKLKLELSPGPEPSNIRVFSIDPGKMVYSKELTGDSFNWDGAGLPAGDYYLSITDRRGITNLELKIQ